MQTASRLLMLCVLIAAPWCLAGSQLVTQPWLFGGALFATAVGIGSKPFLLQRRRLHAAVIVIPLLGTITLALGAWQLLPSSSLPAFPHAVLTSSLQILDGTSGTPGPISLYPAATRLFMARIALTIAAFLGGVWLFSSRRSRPWLWWVLAVNGSAIAVFGLIQKATWNEQIYWTIPLRFGGQPFSAFVNRNNAAGYLSMCLAAAIGLMLRHRSLKNLTRSWQPGKSVATRGPETPGFSWRHPALLATIIMMSTGILATLSRGGTISAAVAFLMTLIWLGGFRRWRFLVIPLAVTLALSVSLLAWIGFGGQLGTRLASLQAPLASDGRARHWTDMLGAVRDFPVSGMGWGTYRYANKPYQNHFSHGRYLNADNEYLEWLVEGGVPGLITVVAGLVTLAVLAWNWHRLGNTAEPVVCGFLLVTQGLQSLTDFGVIVTSNLLTLAVLLGSLSASESDEQSGRKAVAKDLLELLNQRSQNLSSAGIAAVMLVVAALGLAELTTAAYAAGLWDRLPIAMDSPEGFSLAETNAALQAGELRLNYRPDDAELHAAMARLWFHRYQIAAFTTLNGASANPVQSRQNDWDRTRAGVLFSEICRCRTIGAEDSLEGIRRDPIIYSNLVPMAFHLNRARRACPVFPGLGFLEATMAALESGDGSDDGLLREAALNPSDPGVLRQVAFYADRLGDRELFAVSIRRVLQLNPNFIDDLLELARSRLSEEEIVEFVFPENPEALVRIAEKWTTEPGRRAAITKARQTLTSLAAGDRFHASARLAILDSDLDLAQKFMVAAIQEKPLDTSWRLEYSLLLEQRGDRTAALHQVEMCLALNPDDTAAHARATALRTQLESVNTPVRKP